MWKKSPSLIDLPPTGIEDEYWGDGNSDSNSNKIKIARFAVILFILVEAMTFAGLISSYIILKHNNPFNWPPQDQPRYPASTTLVNTFFLILSGILMFLFRKEWWETPLKTSRLNKLLISTLASGLIFLTLQGNEWIKLIRYGLTMKSSLYGSIFYTIIGFHALHVIAACLWLTLSTMKAVKNKFSHRVISLDTCGVFWYFVVLVWPFIYVIVYL